MGNREAILKWLNDEGVDYRLVEHPAAYDMEDITRYGVDAHGEVCKNLFLRDSRKGRRHVLVSVAGHARVDLAALGQAVGERLSFASEGRLEKYLRLQKGEVTPLGVYFDEGHAVEVFFDERLQEAGVVGVHPADNTATVFLPFAQLRRLVESRGNSVGMIKITGINNE